MWRRPPAPFHRIRRPPLLRCKSTLEQRSSTVPIVQRKPLAPHPRTPKRIIPPTISVRLPPYAHSGNPPILLQTQPQIHTDPGPLRRAGRLARRVLEAALQQCQPGVTTAEIDTFVHETILQAGAYPSPLNYLHFPKSVCTSVNEVICHGIPDDRPLEWGDIVSLDVSCYTAEGVHGDNCGTVVIGDQGATPACEEHFERVRSLLQATKECVDAGVAEVRPGACLTSIGAACEMVAESYGYSSVKDYRGHGIGENFHVPPFVSHVRNTDRLELRPNMIFTIEPMICMGSAECFEWESDGWTVATVDGSLSAQFEHMVRVTENGVEILTELEQDY